MLLCPWIQRRSSTFPFRIIDLVQPHELQHLALTLTPSLPPLEPPPKRPMDTSVFAKVFPKEYHLKFLESYCRADGRGLRTVRKVSVTRGVLGTTDGSGLAKVGATSVMCGIKLEVGAPSLDDAKAGRLVVAVDLPDLCSASLPRSSQQRAAECEALSEQLARLATGSGLLKLSDLLIADGQAVWVLYADLVCLSHDGNLFDACVLALQAALQDARLPRTHVDEVDRAVFVTDGPAARLRLARCSLRFPSCWWMRTCWWIRAQARRRCPRRAWAWS